MRTRMVSRKSVISEVSERKCTWESERENERERAHESEREDKNKENMYDIIHMHNIA